MGNGRSWYWQRRWEPAAVPGSHRRIPAAQETAVTLGQPIHFTATASCPSGTPEIQWYQKINSSWRTVGPYSTAATLAFDSTGSVVGTNYFYAAARKQGTTTPVTASATITVRIDDNVASCTAVRLTAPAGGATGNVGSAMTLSALATCPVGVVPEYQFWVKLSSTSAWTMLPGYTTGPSSWTPSSAGSWNVRAAARAQGAHVAYQVLSGSNTVSIAGPVNRPPVAGNDGLATPANSAGTVDVTSNDSDPDGDSFSVTSFTQGAHGTVGFTGGTASYTPATDYVGSDSFTYTITDAHGATATATVNVTVTNLAPVAVDDAITAPANAAGSVDVLVNDTDGDNDGISVTSFTQPAHGTVGVAGSLATYSPATDYVGSDSFGYTITDGHGATASATVHVTVTNLAPTPADDTLQAPANATGSVDVLVNDTDGDHDAFSVTSNTQGAHGSVGFTGSVATYSPATDYVGSDSFTYTVTDANGGTGTATVHVTVTNLAPAANDDAISTPSNAAGSVDVLLNDSDGDHDLLTVTSYTQGTHGSVGFTGSVATYTPAGGYVGSDAFTYTITDALGATATATVHVTVRSVTPGCTISIATTTSSPVYGANIHFVATAACNTGAADIQWYHKENSTWRIIQAYSSLATLDFTAAVVGADYYYATARTHGTTTPVTTSNTLTLQVADNVPSCTAIHMTQPASGATGHVGVAMTLAAAAICPVGMTPEYQFWVKLSSSSSWTILPGYTQTTGSWTPPSTGTWNLKAAARAVGAHVNYQVLSSAISTTISP
ncbi:MAG: tandem-95 repeat protein [Deltaproteobacteria bacterium]|nr:MAG: tandem-95 repeat protein [Deltaproteobacteria bacterium]